jgi:hypothetical protein
LADEAQKDINLLQEDLKKAEQQVAMLKQRNEIHALVEKQENKQQWAHTIRETQSEAEQARIFFEAYQLQLIQDKENK